MSLPNRIACPISVCFNKYIKIKVNLIVSIKSKGYFAYRSYILIKVLKCLRRQLIFSGPQPFRLTYHSNSTYTYWVPMRTQNICLYLSNQVVLLLILPAALWILMNTRNVNLCPSVLIQIALAAHLIHPPGPFKFRFVKDHLIIKFQLLVFDW